MTLMFQVGSQCKTKGGDETCSTCCTPCPAGPALLLFWSMYFFKSISLKVLSRAVKSFLSLKVPLAANGQQAREVWVPSIASTLLVLPRELSAMSVQDDYGADGFGVGIGGG